MKIAVQTSNENQNLLLLARSLELLALEDKIPARVRHLKDRRMLELLMSYIACGGIKQP